MTVESVGLQISHTSAPVLVSLPRELFYHFTLYFPISPVCSAAEGEYGVLSSVPVSEKVLPMRSATHQTLWVYSFQT